VKLTKRMMYTAVLATALASTGATAASWQEKLSSAANQLSQNSGTTAAAQSGGGLSLSSLTNLLNGGNSALSSSSMTNATGVLEYCAKQKLVAATRADSIKEKLFDKLGLSDTQQQSQTQDYQQGLAGLLKTGNGQQLNLNNLGSTPLAEKVKTKACELVLKQGAKFIS
jgi:hypothetical protein